MHTVRSTRSQHPARVRSPAGTSGSDTAARALAATIRAARHYPSGLRPEGPTDGTTKEFATAHEIASLVLSIRRLDGLNDPAAVFCLVPVEICHALGFRRALISEVKGRKWSPRHHHESNADAHSLAKDVQAAQGVARDHQLIESDVIRRRTSALLTSEQGAARRSAWPVTAQAGIVLAPILAEDDGVIGLLHADYGGLRQVGPADQARLASFALHLGLVLERLTLRRELVRQTAVLDKTLRELAQTASSTTAATINLDRITQPRHQPPTARSEPSQVLDGALSPREREVLQLMAKGLINRRIAQELNLAEGTVKSHVKRILRKLRATNRTEAVARYQQLPRLHPPAPETR